ncbi:galactose-3-O-sulfotransferase 4 isoform X2 [Alligator sinensis]|uniref:Galactose-3-O-sulfotransferase 4 isoform X2 n=1 Tax=Alligator sinensis TaxID=38654 RepID=A0A3Q0H5K1_ALLSI|nr:galactose-3-O-sulfotransferase 4 isoform X2 [Alligator sinensis]
MGKRMRLPPRCCRLRVLGVALTVCMTIGFTLQLLGGPFHRRAPLEQQQPHAPRLSWDELSASPRPRDCEPQQHLVFLKTHKTGSSTVVNLLHRFGEARGLRFALPHRYQLGYPLPFQEPHIKGHRPGGAPYDILCHHMRFNLPEVQKVMQADSFYFSIVRDPAALAASAFSYYQAVVSAFRRAGTLGHFAAAPERYYDPAARGNHYARNLLWFDFGLPVPPASGTEADAAMEAALAQLDRTFRLVLLTEHFDESLVLLQEALCWDEDDVAAFPHNGRRALGPAMAPGLAAQLRAWNELDWQLYTHVNRSFWARVEAYGRERMARDVARLRGRRQELAEHCLAGGGPVPASRIGDPQLRPLQLGRAEILGYELRAGLGPAERRLCARMVTLVLQYKDLLDRRQFGGNSTSNPT